MFVHLRYKLLILLSLVVVYWPLLVGDAIMKWDILDINLPWKYYVVECLRNGELPWWNAYNNFGFVQAGDPGSWYIISWIFGLPFHYTLQVMQFEHLFHLAVAAFGMLALLRQLHLKIEIANVGAISYMLCGFFVGNAQHVGWTVAAAWLPWIVFNFRRLLNHEGYQYGLWLALVLFFTLTGGYPGLFIVICYALLFWFIGHQLLLLRAKQQQMQWKVFGHIVVATLFFIGLSALVLNASFHLSTVVDRGKGLSFDPNVWGFYSGALPPKALFTFVLGFLATVPDDAFWTENFTVVNCYMGFFSVLLSGFVFHASIRSKRLVLLFAIAILFIVVAMAKVFPFRYWLTALPFMELFRFASVFRLFALFIFIVLAAVSLHKLFVKNAFKLLQVPLGIASLVFGGATLALLLFADVFHFKILWRVGLDAYVQHTDVVEKIYVQALLLWILSSISWLGFKFLQKQVAFRLVLLCMVLDVVSVAILNGSATVYQNRNSATMERFFEHAPIGFAHPSLAAPMRQMSDSAFAEQGSPVIVNLGAFYKMPFSSGVSPYSLEVYKAAYGTGVLTDFLDQPFAFYKNEASNSAENHQLSWDDFSANKLELNCLLNGPDTLVIQQVYQDEWQSRVDGHEIDLLALNGVFIGVPLSAGTHSVELEYVMPKGKLSALISVLFLCILLGAILFYFFKTDRVKFVVGAILLGFILIEGIYFIGIDSKMVQALKSVDPISLDSLDVIVSNNASIEQNQPVSKLFLDGENARQQANLLYNYCVQSTKNELTVKIENRLFSESSRALLHHFFKHVEVVKTGNVEYLFCKDRIPTERDKFETATHPNTLHGEQKEVKTRQYTTLHSGNPYSESIEIQVSKEHIQQYPYSILGTRVLPPLSTETRFVFEYKSKTGQQYWQDFKFLNQPPTDSSNTYFETAVIDLSAYSPAAGDSIKVFIWNAGKDSAMVGTLSADF